jgi:aspartyl-tRNA(Asn)/glutamyl-tRNA(Gln) amidotransferase subunit A
MTEARNLRAVSRRAFLGAAFAITGSVRITGHRSSRADVTELSLVELLERVRAQTVSPLEAVDAYLDRIARVDKDIGAYITVTPEAARARARQLARSSSDRAQLLGAPIAHKDLFETSGILTTGGSRLFQAHVPERDATVVARLSAAGAISLGKTNTHELGGGATTINPFFGTTRNPHDRDRIAGGSSGGSAAAVVARLAVAATGSDTGGSVRIPAALCGCVGFKPTYGVLSTAGVLGASPTFDHAGFLTRRVMDLVPLMQAAIGMDPRDAASVPPPSFDGIASVSLAGLRIGVPRTWFFADLDSDVSRAVDDALARLSRGGAVLREVRAPLDAATMGRVFDPIVVAEIHQTYQRDWRERPHLFSPSFAEFFKAPVPTGLELAAAHRARRAFQVDMTTLFEDVELLAVPTVPMVAPRIDGPIDGGAILRNTWPFNAAHMPALTLPCGPAGSLPVGLQLAARPFGDGRLLAIASAIERTLA